MYLLSIRVNSVFIELVNELNPYSKVLNTRNAVCEYATNTSRNAIINEAKCPEMYSRVYPNTFIFLLNRSSLRNLTVPVNIKNASRYMYI